MQPSSVIFTSIVETTDSQTLSIPNFMVNQTSPHKNSRHKDRRKSIIYETLKELFFTKSKRPHFSPTNQISEINGLNVMFLVRFSPIISEFFIKPDIITLATPPRELSFLEPSHPHLSRKTYNNISANR